MMVGVSIPILQLRVNLHQLHVLRSILNSVFPSEEKASEGGEDRRVEGDREAEEKEEDAAKERRALVFQDDLRIGSLTFADQPGEGMCVRKEMNGLQLVPPAGSSVELVVVVGSSMAPFIYALLHYCATRVGPPHKGHPEFRTPL